MKKLTLKFEFKLLSGMSLTSLWVHTTGLGKKELDNFRKPDEAKNYYKGEIEISTATDKITFTISGVGIESGLQGTFNFTFNDKKVFSEDQKLSVNQKGRISFNKHNIKLPL